MSGTSWPVSRQQPPDRRSRPPTRKIFLAPAQEPITTGDAKAFCRIEASVTTEDGFIATLITAARQWVESFTKRALMTQTWDLVYDDGLGCEIEIPFGQLQTVTGIYFTDTNDAEGAAEDATKYVVDIAADPGRIMLKTTKQWADSTRRDFMGSRIRFVCGYGAVPADSTVPTVGSVPAEICQAIRRIVLHQYENREEFVMGMGMRIPDGIRELLWDFRIMRIS